VTAGTGVTTLTGAMTYTGDTMIQGGVLSFSNAGASGAGTLGLGVNKPVYIGNGATLRYTGVSATLAGGSSTAANSHNFNLTGGMGTIHIPTANVNLTIAGVISGAGGLTKTGNGILQLNGANTFTGPVVIAAGRLISGNPDTSGNAERITNSSPVTVLAGAVWELLGNDRVGSLSGAGEVRVGGATARTLGVGAVGFVGSLHTIGMHRGAGIRGWRERVLGMTAVNRDIWKLVPMDLAIRPVQKKARHLPMRHTRAVGMEENRAAGFLLGPRLRRATGDH
jgi:autotransporter-associated beta strand protein